MVEVLHNQPMWHRRKRVKCNREVLSILLAVLLIPVQSLGNKGQLQSAYSLNKPRTVPMSPDVACVTVDAEMFTF